MLKSENLEPSDQQSWTVEVSSDEGLIVKLSAEVMKAGVRHMLPWLLAVLTALLGIVGADAWRQQQDVSATSTTEYVTPRQGGKN